MARLQTSTRSGPPSWPAAAVLMVTLLLFAVGLTLFVINGSLPVPLAVFFIVEMGFPAIGFFIVRKTGSRIGWIFLFTGLGLGLQAGLFAYAEYGLGHRPGLPGGVIAAWLSEVVWLPQLVVGTLLLFLFFPNGKLPSPRWRFVLALGLVGTALIESSTVFETTLYSYEKVRAPLAGLIPMSVTDAVASVGSFLLLPALPLAFLSLIFRYRAADQTGRLQIKWFICAASAYLAGQVVFNLFEVGEDNVLLNVLSGLSTLLVPIAVAIAILRYRLYDIDVIINRTLVYGVLTAALLASYLLIVVTLSRVLDPVTQDSDIAVAASTLVVAALFGPLRRWIQGFIDRRFYRRKYDSAEALKKFSERLRHEIEVDVVSSDVLGVVQDTLQPRHASVWLRSGGAV